MKLFFASLFALVLATSSLSAVEQTWTGNLTDSLCGADHPEDADAAGGGKQGKPDPHDCTLACVRGGSKYVLVVDGKMYHIANQDLPALALHAGHAVKLTGELKDTTITVSKIEM